MGVRHGEMVTPLHVVASVFAPVIPAKRSASRNPAALMASLYLSSEYALEFRRSPE